MHETYQRTRTRTRVILDGVVYVELPEWITIGCVGDVGAALL
jgi:hypothetical protein